MMSNTKTMFENQRSITVKKESYNDRKLIYGKIGDEPAKTAFQMLSKNTFSLWFYIVKNQPDFEFGLSRVAVMEYCNISKNSYHRAFKELVETGYLIQTGSNTYDFYEIPQMPKLKVHKSNYVDWDIEELAESISK